MSKYFSTSYLNHKMITAFILFYIFGALVIWDELNSMTGVRRIVVTVIIAVSIDIILFAFRESCNNSKKVKILFGSILLLVYVVLGLTFQGFIFHFMFGMTGALALVIASFFLDLGKF